jgi:hypothetical protein
MKLIVAMSPIGFLYIDIQIYNESDGVNGSHSVKHAPLPVRL